MSKLLKIALAELEETNVVEDKNSVTYDEGTGKKDLVVMTGPLSNIYTKALNLYFAKKDVNDDPIGEDVASAQSASVATESAMIDTVMSTALSNHLDKDTNALSSVQLVSDSQDIEATPKTIIFSTDASSATNPEVITAAEIESAKYEDSGKDWFVFIGPDSSGKLGTQFVQSDVESGDDVNAFNTGEQFKRATESLYATRGIRVIFGFESLLESFKAV